MLPVLFEQQASGSNTGAQKFDEIASAQPGGLCKTIVEKASQRREKDKRNEKQSTKLGVGSVDRLFRDLSGAALESKRSEYRGDERVVSERAQELSDQKQVVIAVWFHEIRS